MEAGVQRKVRAKLPQRVVPEAQLVFAEHGQAGLAQKTRRIEQHQPVNQILLQGMGEEPAAPSSRTLVTCIFPRWDKTSERDSIGCKRTPRSSSAVTVADAASR